MNQHKKFVKPAKRTASLDGMVSDGRTLGVPVQRSYQPRLGPKASPLGKIDSRGDGFHALRQSAHSVGHAPTATKAEAAEADALLDEPIILDDEPVKPSKKAAKKDKNQHYFGRKRPKLRKYLKRGSLGLLVLFLLVGGFLFWKLEHNLSKVFHGNILGVFHPVTKLKGEDQGRVTILLAGNSADDAGHDGANLTDSIMLISLDTVNNTGYMLSIPRDLWVSYDTTSCSLGYQGKINAVYECGQETNFKQAGYPSGGMGLLEQVVSQDFGVKINYSALVNYSGLRDAVNAVGGIEFTVNSPDSCGLYDGGKDYDTGGILVNLSNGKHLLNGQQALDLARARGDPPYQSCGYENSDFTRTQNQRQEVLDLKSKAFTAGVISNPAKLSSLLDAVGNNVQTDFQSNEILRFYSVIKKIPNSSIKSVGLADKNVSLIKSDNINGASALIPAAGEGNYDDIQTYMQRLNSHDPVVTEDASVAILNGSNTAGLASKASTTLTNKGLSVIGIDDDTVRPTTVIVQLNKQKTATLAYLQKTYKVTATTNAAAYPEVKNYNSDFVIILGNDAANSTQ